MEKGSSANLASTHLNNEDIVVCSSGS